MRQRWDIAASLWSLGLLGCTQTIHLSVPPGPPTQLGPRTSVATEATPGKETHERLWTNHFLLGFVRRKDIDTRDHCEGRAVTEVRLVHGPLTVLLWAATVGIYTPRLIEITCAPEDP